MDDQSYTIADKSYDRESGELTQFLVFWDGGEPELKRASAENVLLFDPEDELPFDNGLYDFLNGQHALKLSDDPELIIGPTANEYAYIIRYDGNTVETTPSQSERVLQGILDVAEGNGISGLTSVYDDIMSSQVRRYIINALRGTFDDSERIEVIERGWLIDEYYLVDWSASLWTIDDDPDEGDFERRGGSAERVDKSYEFVQIRVNRRVEPMNITISGDEYRLTEREMLFLSKVKWLLHRRHYHGDMSFWMYNDQNAAVDWKTGEPESEDPEPDTDTFNL